MVAEEMEEFALAYEEAAYEDPGEYMPMGFMATGRGFHDGNVSHWWYHKQPSFLNQTCPDNTNWETAAMHMSVAEDSIINATDRSNAPLECWE